MEAQKEMIARLIRYGLLFVSGWLVTKGLVPQDFADTWLNETTALVAGFVIVTIPVIWGHLKARFDNKVIEVAVQLPKPDNRPLAIKAAVAEAKMVASGEGSAGVPY